MLFPCLEKQFCIVVLLFTLLTFQLSPRKDQRPDYNNTSRDLVN